MEIKIVDTLGEMGEVLSNYFPPSHAKLYALKRLGIEVPKVHHVLRKKEVVADDREKLSSLLNDLKLYVDHYVVSPFQKYYVSLWQKNIVDILNGD